jgi:short-subunit dehydrogenase involved in D-alanine esterification of teichoic acids
MRVSGHKVVITGGSTGIGFALAKAFKERGNQVLIAARRLEGLKEAAGRISGIFTAQCDVASDGDLRRLLRLAHETIGGISVLVNNAGIQCNDDYPTAAAKIVMDNVDQEVGINFVGLVKLTALCMPLLRNEEEAAVVNISSILAIAPKQSAPVYCATKAAVRSFSKALRWQLEDAAPSVRVFDVLPPLVDTEMTRERQGSKIPPASVADATLRGMERDRFEILVGASRKLARAHRIHPRLADRIVRRR